MWNGNLSQHRLTFITLGKSIKKHLKELSTKIETLTIKCIPRHIS